MKTNKTDITILLDRSLSMSNAIDKTINGFNEFLKQQTFKQDEAEITLIQFDEAYEPNYVAVPVYAAQPLNRLTFVPRGNTALLDSMARAVKETGERLAALPEELRPGKVIFMVITDGEENASKTYNQLFGGRQKVMDMVTHQTQRYSWNFLYLGANQDAIAVGQSLGIPQARAATYTMNNVEKVYATMSGLTSKIRSGNLNAGFSNADRCALTNTDDDRVILSTTN